MAKTLRDRTDFDAKYAAAKELAKTDYEAYLAAMRALGYNPAPECNYEAFYEED